MAESAENISPMKQNVPAISPQVVSRKSLRLSMHRASNIRGRTGYHVLKIGITLVRRPIWGFTLLPRESLILLEPIEYRAVRNRP